MQTMKFTAFLTLLQRCYIPRQIAKIAKYKLQVCGCRKCQVSILLDNPSIAAGNEIVIMTAFEITLQGFHKVLLPSKLMILSKSRLCRQDIRKS